MKHYLLAGLLLAAVPALAQTAPPASTPPSLLASAVVAGLVSAVVSGGIALLVKDKEYKNDYYKKVIDKRIKAIESVEAITSLFTACHYSEGGELYQAIFYEDDGIENIYKQMDEYGKYSLWIKIDTLNAIKKLTLRLNNMFENWSDKTKEEKEAIGVENYEYISFTVRTINYHLHLDVASLHNVKGFFKDRSVPGRNQRLPRIREK